MRPPGTGPRRELTHLPETSTQSQGIRSSDPCGSPCWHGTRCPVGRSGCASSSRRGRTSRQRHSFVPGRHDESFCGLLLITERHPCSRGCRRMQSCTLPTLIACPRASAVKAKAPFTTEPRSQLQKGVTHADTLHNRFSCEGVGQNCPERTAGCRYMRASPALRRSSRSMLLTCTVGRHKHRRSTSCFDKAKAACPG